MNIMERVEGLQRKLSRLDDGNLCSGYSTPLRQAG